MDLVSKAEITLSTKGSITISKDEKAVTFTAEQLWRLVSKHKLPQSKPKKFKGLIDKYDLDVPGRRGKARKGEDYFLLYERIKTLGFTDKKLEHNILDCQRKQIISRKWRKDGMIHIPSFIMEASEGEILKVLNFQK